MLILGIDLSSQPRKTAACLLDCRDRHWSAASPEVGCNDARLDEAIGQAHAVGIDAPFGWPEAFVEVVVGWASPTWSKTLRDRLRFRLTDCEVTRRTGLRPLSVSTDKIALPAMRAMALLHRHGVTDKSGDGRFFEVYPAASLSQWKLPHRGYKSDTAEGQLKRQAMLSQLRELFPELSAPDEYVASDHALDALIAAITTRAAVEHETIRPTSAQLKAAQVEGWIHLTHSLETHERGGCD